MSETVIEPLIFEKSVPGRAGLPWPACALWMALGKGARYAVVLAGAGLG